VTCRATYRTHGLTPGQLVKVDPRARAIKRLLAAGALVPVKGTA
jgi:hypothetical protein